MKIKTRTMLIQPLLYLSFITCVLTNFGYYNLYYAVLIGCSAIIIMLSLQAGHQFKIDKRIFNIIFMVTIIAIYSIAQRNYYNVLKFIVWSLVAYIGYNFVAYSNENEKKRFGRVILTVLVLASFEGLNQFITGNMSFTGRLVSWGDNLRQGAVSIFLQHIVWGHVLLIGFFVNEYVNKGMIRSILRILLLINLYACQSRASWLTLVIYLVIVSFKFLKQREIFSSINKYSVIKFMLAFVGVGIIIYYGLTNSTLKNVMETIVSHLGSLFTGQARYRTSTIEALIDYRINKFNLMHWLLGSGYGSSSEALSYYGLSLSNKRYIVDNQIISVFFEFGFIVGCYIIYLFMNAIRVFILSRDKVQNLINGIFICNILMSLVYESFGYQVSAYIFFFTFGAKLAIDLKKIGLRRLDVQEK